MEHAGTLNGASIGADLTELSFWKEANTQGGSFAIQNNEALPYNVLIGVRFRRDIASS
jgi:hypothetical protein